MTSTYTLPAKTVAIRSLLVGVGVVTFVALAQSEIVKRYSWPAILALWIAGIVGSYMMAWTRSGGRRWLWAAVGTVLLALLVGLFAVTIPVALVSDDAGTR